MNPLLLSALFSFGPGLLGGLLGGNPQEELRRKIARLLSPQNVGNTTNQFYQNAISSPAYSQAQGTIAAGANQAQAQLARALGAQGIQSGSSALTSSLVPSLVGSQQAGLRTGAYNSAQQQAMQQIQAQIQNLQGTQGPSPLRQGLSGGIEAFAPFLEQWLKQRYPNFGAQTQVPSWDPNFIGPRIG